MSQQQPLGGKWKKRMGWFLLSGFVFAVAGCITLKSLGYWPVTLPPLHLSKHQAESRVRALTSALHTLLQKHVDTQGRVNYKALAKDRDTLDQLLATMAHISPETHPQSFPDQQARLAYWINAYNASVLRAVLHVAPWSNLTPYPRKVLFFGLIRFVYGGKPYNLYDLENKKIRPDFQEPRIHFALNCASAGCPHLPPEAFDPKRLNDQLDRETKKFVQQARNVRVEKAHRTIYLSPIFQWFRSDFTDWLRAHNKPSQASDRILDYINLYRPKEKQLPQKGYKITYVLYDWKMNKQ